MESFDIIRQILSEIGGDSGDPNDEYVRHVLPMIMWGVIFITGWSFSRQSPNRRGRWLLFAIAGAWLQEFVQFFVNITKNLQEIDADGLATFSLLERINDPLSDGSMALMFLVLSVAMARFVYSYDDRERHMRLALVAVLFIAVATLVLMAIWVFITRDGQYQNYKTSWVHLCFILGSIAILGRSSWRLCCLCLESDVSRIAWIPFVQYLVSQLLLLVAMFSSTEQNHWLLPISNNLVIWATPWFGYLYWRDLIEEQRHLALRLHQAERLEIVGRLAAGVAHDFNNHLQSILGFAEVGLLEAKSDVRQQGNYHSIMQSVGRARVLVNKLMAFKREGPDAEISVVNLPSVVADLAPMLTSLMGAGISLDNQLGQNANNVWAERSMLEQAIVNVVVNARDSMPNGGTLTVKSHRLSASKSDYSQAMIRLTIADTGRGMSTYERERVFEPFYTTKSPQHGSGLGLASSLSAIRGMGGEIKIDSLPGRGTTLIIDLPAADEAPIEKTDNEPFLESIETLRGSERILVAEDESALRHIASLHLTRAGYDVALARDGEHAMELIEAASEPFDLLLLDVVMPHRNGDSVYQAAKLMYPTIRAVFVSADTESVQHQAVGVRHITKPFTQHTLLKTVRNTLDQPK